MTFRLGHGVHWCECAGRIVFLDLFADRYACLDEVRSAAFKQFASTGEIPESAAEALDPLLLEGLLVEGELGEPIVSHDERLPVADRLDEPLPSPRALEICRVVLVQLRYAALLRLLPLPMLLRGNPTPGPAASDVTDADDQAWLSRMAAAFRDTALLLPETDRCLVRAIAFRAMCQRRGLRPALVFGVRLDPFRAHCWLEWRGEVLIGSLEQARLFKRIAVFA